MEHLEQLLNDLEGGDVLTIKARSNRVVVRLESEDVGSGQEVSMNYSALVDSESDDKYTARTPAEALEIAIKELNEAYHS